jgi:anti-sigma regulatory factor (Ser/Thr protein kinase)
MTSMTATRTQAVSSHPDHRQPGPGTWPLHAALDLGALPTTPGCGRDWTRQIAWEWQLAPLADSAELIASELLTNAVLASSELDLPAIGLSLLSDQMRLVILVRDYHPAAPAPRHASDDDESGRGLMLVEGLSDHSGWYRPGDGTPGKVVWALLEALPRPVQHPAAPGKPPDLPDARVSGIAASVIPRCRGAMPWVFPCSNVPPDATGGGLGECHLTSLAESA